MHMAYNGRLPSTQLPVLQRNVICHTQLEHAIHYWYHVLTLLLWRTLLHIEALSFGICCLPNILTLLTQAFVTLQKNLKLLIFLRPLNLTYYQPRLLVLNMKILYIIKIKLIFLCLIDSFQNALDCILLYLIYMTV